MAEISLKGLNDKEIQALQEAINKQKRLKVDWDNMTDEERAWKNRTVDPPTPNRPTPQSPRDPGWYPRVLYGKVSGQIVGPTIKDAAEETRHRARYPDESGMDWNGSLLDLGIETSPSKPEGHVVGGWQHFGAGRLIDPPNPAVDVMNNPAPEPPVIPAELPKQKDMARSEAIKRGQAAAKARREAA